MLNKYEKMEIVSFDDIEDVYDTIGIELMHLEDEEDYIAVYGKVDLIKELFTIMISDGYEFGYADFDTLDEMRKDMIYMMFIRGNCVISVEPAYNNNGVVIGHDAKVALFYMNDCKQDVIDYCVKRDMKVTLFDFDEDDCDDCSECACKNDEKPATASTTASKSATYKINNKEVSKEEFDKKYEEFEEMYLDNIRDMLLGYCNFMDEVNEWRSRMFRW